MPKPVAMIEYNKCKPEKCNPDKGVCNAVMACTYNVLNQEDIYESPMVFPTDMCQGCGDCIQACSLKAIILIDT